MNNSYAEAGDILLEEFFADGGKIRKWRDWMAGAAWYETKEIACPMPRTAKSFEIFAHEVGHILANPDRKAPSWKRELQASEYALEQFERFNLKLPRETKKHIYWYITYSVCQALNRGMKKVPDEVKKYTAGRIAKVPKVKFIRTVTADGWTYERRVVGYRHYAK